MAQRNIRALYCSFLLIQSAHFAVLFLEVQMDKHKSRLLKEVPTIVNCSYPQYTISKDL